MSTREDEYQKQVEEAAQTFWDDPYEEICLDNHDDSIAGFKAGAKWCRANPPPEVLALVEALNELAKSGNVVAHNALAAFDARGK